jgi:hypothetical protein
MTLGDISNLILTHLQQGGAQFATGGATAPGPNWAGSTNPQYSQGLIEFCINEGYKKVMGDLDDIELFLTSYTTSSIAQTFIYPFPPAPTATLVYPEVSHIARIIYQPFGLLYKREFRPGTELTSWPNFNTITGQGYLLPYSFGTQPTWATVDPLRQNIYFYPGSARSGDSITIQYTPIPTPYLAGVQPISCPILVASTDTPVLPYDCHMAIFYFALWLLWIRAREMSMAEVSLKSYKDELAMIKYKYTKIQHGDTIRVEPFLDRIGMGTDGR